MSQNQEQLQWITSFIEQPNTTNVTTGNFEQKYQLAADGYANYSFMMGATNDNLEEVLKLIQKCAGIKIFFISTKIWLIMLRFYENISSTLLIAVHCEDDNYK
jgi:dihydroorotase